MPGDGRYEWDGFLPITALPHVANPEKGYFATANNYLFPLDYPFKEALHYSGADPFRVSRISEVLGSGRLHTVADMMRLQNDNVSLPARSLVPLLREASDVSDTVGKARSLLLGWNYSVDADSVAAGIYEMWQQAAVGEYAESGRAEGGAVVCRAAEHEAHHRLAERARRPVRRRCADAGRDEILAKSLD